MNGVFKWLGRIALALILAAIAVGLWKRDEITRLWAVNSLFDKGRIVQNFSNMEHAFLTVPVPRGTGPVSRLPRGPVMTLPERAVDWIEARTLTSLMVLHQGAVVHESYHLGTGPQDRRISWSMAKSFVSALFGVVVEEGAIESLDDPVTRYAPGLIGSAYDGARIRDVLLMMSGVRFDEDYLDYDSDINRMGRTLALGGAMDKFAAGLNARIAPPGKRWQYVSVDTHVLAMVLRGATGRSLPDLMSEKIIQPLGLEVEPFFITDGEGVAIALGGLNLTTRDYARFGLMAAGLGSYRGTQIVPEAWMRAATVPTAPTEPGELKYGYQWWMPRDVRDGEYFGHGIYGQYIYIDRAKDVVIVVTAADRGFREDGVRDRNIAMLRRIARAL
ncbi:serine hydrolase [uncultured Roseovarius sp.]|uniref:serine hydrolase domain-containing protein n=1 Tax=uncultured Roseovarius sp. TaxID=293344 RepID=UPI00261F7044|nr:serine hydrolase [uncultured Roseovarius sp.]